MIVSFFLLVSPMLGAGLLLFLGYLFIFQCLVLHWTTSKVWIWFWVMDRDKLCPCICIGYKRTFILKCKGYMSIYTYIYLCIILDWFWTVYCRICNLGSPIFRGNSISFFVKFLLGLLGSQGSLCTCHGHVGLWQSRYQSLVSLSSMA